MLQPWVSLLIEIDWYGKKIQLDCEEATHHAMCLLKCVEASEVDAFLRYFISQKMEFSLEEGQFFVDEFRKFRQIQSLNSLLKNKV